MAAGSKDISRLTEDLLVEILSRVPYKSLCCFKCVSKRWRGIISDPNHRKALPKYHLDDLAGFLYSSIHPDYLLPLAHNFANVSAGGRLPIRPWLPFLPDYERMDLLDSCNGLLLCRHYKTTSSRAFDYVVCNPATEKWVALPGYFSNIHTAHLGFDPAVSSYFHVFLILKNDDDNHVKGIEIYSSETGGWSHKASGWGFSPWIVIDSKSVFLNGFLHLVTDLLDVVAVNVEGTTWRVIPSPRPYDEEPDVDADAGFIGLSQGRLYLANADQHEDSELSIWVLQNYDSQVWVLEHSVSYLNLFGRRDVHLENEDLIVALHPERNMIFLVYGGDRVLMSYEMDSGNVRFIHGLGHDSVEPYLPYVPLYSEVLANWP